MFVSVERVHGDNKGRNTHRSSGTLMLNANIETRHDRESSPFECVETHECDVGAATGVLIWKCASHDIEKPEGSGPRGTHS